MARCPDWYLLFVAADRCNCKPWELLEAPVVWKEWALKAMTAESQAKEQLQQMGR